PPGILPSAIMLARRGRPALDLFGRVRAAHKVQPVTHEVVVEPQPPHRPRYAEYGEKDKLRQQLSTQGRAALPQLPREDTPHHSAGDPTVVTRKDLRYDQ